MLISVGLVGILGLCTHSALANENAPEYEACACGTDYFDKYLPELSNPGEMCESDDLSPIRNLVVRLQGWNYLADPEVIKAEREAEKVFPKSCMAESMMQGPEFFPKYDKKTKKYKDYPHHKVCFEKGGCWKKKALDVNEFSSKAKSCHLRRNCDGSKLNFVKKPCASKKYVDVVYRSFAAVSKCLGLDPREWGSFLNQESHFHINTISPSSAAGPGQLTKDAIGQVNLIFKDPNYYKRKGFIDIEKIKSNPSCEALRPFFNKQMSASNKICERLSLPENPMANLLYSGIYSLYLQGKAKKSLAKYQKFIRTEDRADFEKLYAIWIYNAGEGHLRGIMDEFTTGPPKVPKNLKAEDFYEQFVKYLYSNFPKKKKKLGKHKRREVACYPDHILSGVEKVKNQDSSCFGEPSYLKVVGKKNFDFCDRKKK